MLKIANEATIYHKEKKKTSAFGNKVETAARTTKTKCLIRKEILKS